ncbi:MAG: S41 family peptidase [Vulcanimicrobiaceae bacterium]
MHFSYRRAAAALLLAFALAPVAGSAAAGETTLSPANVADISISFDHLLKNFYKPVNQQQVLNGTRASLLASLKKIGVHGNLPVLHAGSNTTLELSQIDHEIEAAAHQTHGKLSVNTLSYAALSGMMQSVHDRWTVFLDPKDFSQLNQALDGVNFGGTGIVIQKDTKTKFIEVTSVIPHAPADKAGIRQGDLITAVNGASTRRMTIQEASKHLRGKIGTTVTLTIQRDGKLLAPIIITRAKIHAVSVYSRMLPHKIGYVELSVFGETTGHELAVALAQLQKEGARAIILDLRDNGGGYLQAAISVSSKFISSGPIVSIESRGSNVTTLEANDTAISPPLPLAVLVNGNTASASEITSGAIQDTGVGVIIGTKTFGKGVVQTIYRLPGKSAVKITTARYLTPLGRYINHRGIIPDIVVHENKHPRYGQPAHDAQLRRAMQYLEDRLAHSA